MRVQGKVLVLLRTSWKLRFLDLRCDEQFVCGQAGFEQTCRRHRIAGQKSDSRPRRRRQTCE